jgi:ribosome-associated translation inhibitor RaiA
MDLVTLTVATDKAEFRCNAELSETERTAAMEMIDRLAKRHPEIVRVYVDVEQDVGSDEPRSCIAKGQIDLGGPNLLASVANGEPLKSIEFLLENFDRQLRRCKQPPKVRTSIRAPQSTPKANN